MSTSKIVKFFFACIAISSCVANEYMDPEWIDPHAWSRDDNPLAQLCPQSQPCKPCEQTAQAPYLRLVNSLFNPSEFRYDDSTNYFYRVVHIHATEEQLKKITESKHINQVDGLVSDVLAQTNFGTAQLVKEYSVDVASTVWKRVDRIIDTFTESLPRSHVFVNFVGLVGVFFLCRRYNFNFALVIIFFTIYSVYSYLDYECYKRMEADEIADLMFDQQKAQCMNQGNNNWYNWMFGRDTKTVCRDYLAKQNNRKTQCGVTDLFHEFMINIVLKQVKIFFTSLAEIVATISTTNGILVAAITLYFMKDLLGTIIYSTFKFILNPSIWSKVAQDMSRAPPAATPSLSSQSSSEHIQALHQIDLANKTLDLANNQMKLILATSSTPAPPSNTPQAIAAPLAQSSVEIISTSKNTSTESSEILETTEEIDSDASYEELSPEEFMAQDSKSAFTANKITPTSVIDVSSDSFISSGKSTTSTSTSSSSSTSPSSTSPSSNLASDIEFVSSSIGNVVVTQSNPL